MKKSMLLFFLLLAGSQISLAAGNPVDTPEKLVHQLVRYLHASSADSFMDSCVICSPETRTAELQNKETPLEVINKCTKKLKTIRKSLNDLKVTVRQTVSDESRWLPEDIKTRLKVKSGFQKTDIYFMIQDDVNIVWIKLDDCFQVIGEWYVSEPVIINVFKKNP